MSPHCLEGRHIRAELRRRFPNATPMQIKRAFLALAYGAGAKRAAQILTSKDPS